MQIVQILVLEYLRYRAIKSNLQQALQTTTILFNRKILLMLCSFFLLILTFYFIWKNKIVIVNHYVNFCSFAIFSNQYSLYFKKDLFSMFSTVNVYFLKKIPTQKKRLSLFLGYMQFGKEVQYLAEAVRKNKSIFINAYVAKY